MPRLSALDLKNAKDVNDILGNCNLAQTGKIGRSAGLGAVRLGFSYLGDTRTFQGIFQKRVTGYNNRGRLANRERKTYYVRERSYRPTNPRTPLQQANRQKLLDANQAWKDLTPVDKLYYNERGKKASRIGRMIFISWYMKNH